MKKNFTQAGPDVSDKKAAREKKRQLAAQNRVPWKRDIRKNLSLYIIFIIPAVYYFVFRYMPMPGILMAFQNYKPQLGLLGSEWVGMQNFIDLFTGDQFPLALRNNICMSLINITLGFVAPVILAMLMAEVKSKRFSSGVQLITYIPFFISSVVVCSLAREFFNSTGAVTQLLSLLGLERQNWLANNSPVFWFINLFLNIWQGAGYSAIIYLASIRNISHELYEAAAIDGSNRWSRMIHITIPGIMPILVMTFVLQIGNVLNNGVGNILLLYMPSTYEYADVISTYTYRLAFGATSSFGLSTASGLFQSVVGLILLIVGNKASKKVTDYSLF